MARRSLLFFVLPSIQGCMQMTPSPESTLSRSPLRTPDPDSSGGTPAAPQGQRSPPSLPEEQIHAAKTFRDRRISQIYSAASDELSLTVAEQQQNHSKFSKEEQEPLGTWEEASGEEISMNLIQRPEPSRDIAADQTENVCQTCPPLFVSTPDDDTLFCSNWRSVQDSFGIAMTSSYKAILDRPSSTTCTRTVTCEEPYMLVRWFNSTICDVHSLATRVANSFTYDCNGTSWSIHSFPIDNVTCARKASH